MLICSRLLGFQTIQRKVGGEPLALDCRLLYAFHSTLLLTPFKLVIHFKFSAACIARDVNPTLQPGHTETKVQSNQKPNKPSMTNCTKHLYSTYPTPPPLHHHHHHQNFPHFPSQRTSNTPLSPVLSLIT